MITTRDIKIKDQEPKKLTIISTGDVEPKGFVIKGKGKKKSEQIITTGNIEDEKIPLTADQKKTIADIKKKMVDDAKKSKKIIADLQKVNEKLRAKEKAEKKKTGKKPAKKEAKAGKKKEA